MIAAAALSYRGAQVRRRTMISVDGTIPIPYAVRVMLILGRHRDRYFGRATLMAALLAVVLALCLVAGTMASQDSCQDLGSPPGLCSKVVNHADHLLAIPAPLNTSLSDVGISEILSLPAIPTTPSLGLLSTADGRAPPIA